MPRLILPLAPLEPAVAPPGPVADPVTHPKHAAVVDLAGVATDSATTLGRWSAAVAASPDGCLVLDRSGQVVNLSGRGGQLLGCGNDGVAGRRFLDLVSLVDFDTSTDAADYVERVPPLSAISNSGVSRMLIRLRLPDDSIATLDVCGMPLHEADGSLVGSLSWISPLSTS